MFIDYYKVLGVVISASAEEIKTAYHSLSKKWHPDLNPDRDVTDIMQLINEAYCILGNPQKRERYNEEYRKYQEYRKRTEIARQAAQQHRKSNSQHESTHQSTSFNSEYNVSDEHVKSDIENARKRAKEYVDEFMQELRESNRRAVKSGSRTFLTYIIVGLIMSLIALFFPHC